MEFFLDTASIKDIEHYMQLGLVDGVTTNPALLAKEGRDPLKQVKEITSIVSGPVSVEVTYTEPEKMIKHAGKLSSIAENVVIKVPGSMAGLAVARQLKKDGIKTNITLIFHATQALPFIGLGADYVSVFIGRVEDFGLNNVKLIGDTAKAIAQMGSSTKLISASMRNPIYLLDAVLGGSDVITVPPSCWEKVYMNPLFELGEKQFLESWKKLPAEVRKKYEAFD